MLIATGAVVNLVTVRSHLRLDRGSPAPSRSSTQAVLIALFLALVELAMAVYLVSVNDSVRRRAVSGGRCSLGVGLIRAARRMQT